MPTYARRSEKKYSTPPAGLYQGVCCDIVDLGLVTTTWDNVTRQRHKVLLVFQLVDIDPKNGKPYQVAKRYTLSLDKKASLTKDLESWRGKAFTEEGAKEFDLDTLLGVNCQLNLVHNVVGDSTYANIQSIVPIGRNMAKIQVAPDYVRHRDRAREEGPQEEAGPDDDCPF